MLRGIWAVAVKEFKFDMNKRLIWSCFILRRIVGVLNLYMLAVSVAISDFTTNFLIILVQNLYHWQMSEQDYTALLCFPQFASPEITKKKVARLSDRTWVLVLGIFFSSFLMTLFWLHLFISILDGKKLLEIELFQVHWKLNLYPWCNLKFLLLLLLLWLNC